MATITMPQLGESVTEGTIARWLKQPGEKVERYEAIAEVITDKVNAEIPAPTEGVMGNHLVEEGAVVAVGAPICDFDEAGAGAAPSEPQPVAAPAAAEAPQPAAPAAAPPPAAEQTTAPEQPVPAAAPAETAPAAPAAVPSTNGSGADVGHVTPAVRMLAREHGVDLSRVSGSGLGGRITKKDVLGFVQQQGGAAAPAAASPSARAGVVPAPSAPAAPPAPAAPAAPVAPAPPGGPSAPTGAGDTLVPLSPARRAIAEHMVRSRQTSPHAWTMVEVDMTAVARVRAANRAAFKAATGADLTFLPFAAQAVCRALREYPGLNAAWSADGIVLKRDINLGLAVALEDNLIVPVIKAADGLNLAGLGRAIGDLIARARAGKLRIDDLQGGTFTLNNAGALGTVMSQAIINQPQAAICVMDGIVKRPIVVGDAIAIRSIMNLSVSFDHRINDGLQATRFLVSVKRQLEGIDESAPII